MGSLTATAKKIPKVPSGKPTIVTVPIIIS